MKPIRTYLLFVLMLVTATGFAQNFPVQTTMQLTPPYTSYLPDYTDGTNSKLQVALQVTDLTVSALQVKLRFTLEGPGGRIETSANYFNTQPSITLLPGAPYILSGSELTPFLSVDNLQFPTSAFEQNYRNTKVLPEGLWKLCVDVYDASNANSELLSTNSCALLMAQRLQPPILNAPFCETTLPRSAMVNFSWTDLALGSGIDPTGVSYNFALYLVPTGGIANINQVLSTQPIYTETTNLRQLSLDTNIVKLPGGRQYVWQVQVQDIYAPGAYLNNGYSAPCLFTYGDLTQEVIDDLRITITATGTAPNFGVATWSLNSLSGNTSNQFDDYTIAYRKVGNTSNYWYEEQIDAFQYVIRQLEPQTTYQVRIKGRKDDYESIWFGPVNFTTTAYPNYTCGDANFPSLPYPYDPLLPDAAYKGMKVRHGQFVIDVTSIAPEGTVPGHYRGTGRIRVDFIYTSVRVSFTDLTIDNLYNSRQGDVNVINRGFENWLDDQYVNNTDPIYVNGVIASGVFTNSTTVQVTLTDGTVITYTVTDPLPTIVRDDNNNEYRFWPDGRIEITTYGTTPSTDKLAATKDQFIYFVSSTDQVYPTDKKEYGQFAENYELITGTNGFTYYVSNKAVANDAADVAKAYFHSNNFQQLDQTKVEFKIKDSEEIISFTRSDSTYTINLPVRDFNYVLYAYYNGEKIGKLNVKSQSLIKRKVRIVPLVNTTLNKADLEAALANMYKGANLQFEVEITTKFNTSVFTDQTTFANPDVTLQSKYTAQMRDLRDKYLETNQVGDQLLVFIVKDFTDATIEGYMVKGRSLGFLSSTVLSNMNNFKRLLGHELGHGTGGLEHTWGETAALKGTTNNLMDYNGGTKLIASQWEELRNPAFRLNLFDTEEDGSAVSVNSTEISKLVGFKNGSVYTFVTPSGRPISIPATVTQLQFSSPDSYWVKSGTTNPINPNTSPIGCLEGFVLNGVFHAAAALNGQFLGYLPNGSTTYYSSTEPSTYNYILGGFAEIVNGNVRFKVCPLDVAKITANTSNLIGGGANTPKFAFLKDYFTANSQAQGVDILATYSGIIDRGQLNWLSQFKSNAFGKEAIYAVEILYLLMVNEKLGNCVADVFKQASQEIEAANQQRIKLENASFFSLPSSTLTATSYYTPNIDQLDQVNAMYPTSSISDYTHFFEFFYYALTDYISGIAGSDSYYHQATYNDNTDIGAYSDYIFYNLTSGQRQCYLSQINETRRIQLLQEFREWTWGSDKERLLIELIQTAPEDQYSGILSEFKKDNFALLRGLNNDLWNADNYELFNTVSWMVLHDKNASINYKPVSYIYDSGTPSTEPHTIILMKGADANGLYTQTTSIPWLDITGDIVFAIKHYDNGTLLYSGSVAIDPFEIVILRIEDDYQFADITGKQAKKGDTYAVPAIYAYWMVQEQEKIKNYTTIRVLMGVIGIAGAVFTANPSFYATVEAVISGIDVIMAATEDDVLSSPTASIEQKNLYEGWNEFTNTIDLIDAASITKSISNGLYKYAMNRSDVKSAIRSAKDFPSKIADLRNSAARIFSNSKTNLFNSGFNIFKDEIELTLKEIEVNRLLGAQDQINLKLGQSNDVMNLSYISNGNAGNALIGYMTVLPDGKVVLDQLNFTTDLMGVDRVLGKLQGANYRTAAGNLVNEAELRIVLTKTGAVKVIGNADYYKALNLIDELDFLGHTALKTKLLDATFGEANLIKFADDFAGADASLLQAFDANTELLKAWAKIREGGINDIVKQSTYINTLRKVAKYQDEAALGSTGTVKYYRVQTEHPDSKILIVEPNGNLTFNKPDVSINISTTNRDHANYFAAQRISQGNTVEIIEFEVPKSFDVQMKEAAIPQYKSTQNLLNPTGTAPKIVDPIQPGDPFELPLYWHQLLQQNYIPGTAKYVSL